MSFQKLKQKSKTGFKQLKEKMENENKGGNYDDPRFWTPDIDKTGSGFAVIRFLPSVDGEEDTFGPYVKTFSHGFKVGTKWFVEKCLTTIGQECPV